MNKGTVELKIQDGTAIKIKGSADFVAAVMTAILEVRANQADTFRQPRSRNRLKQANWPIVIRSRITSSRPLRIIPQEGSLAGRTKAMLVAQRGRRTLRRQLYHTVSGSVS